MAEPEFSSFTDADWEKQAEEDDRNYQALLDSAQNGTNQDG